MLKMIVIGAAALLASASPAMAQTIDPAAAHPDAKCFAAVMNFLTILDKQPEATKTEMRDTSEGLHRAMGFYAARITSRFADAALGAQVKAATSFVVSLTPDQRAKLGSTCMDDVGPELTKIAKALGG